MGELVVKDLIQPTKFESDEPILLINHFWTKTVFQWVTVVEHCSLLILMLTLLLVKRNSLDQVIQVFINILMASLCSLSTFTVLLAETLEEVLVKGSFCGTLRDGQ